MVHGIRRNGLKERQRRVTERSAARQVETFAGFRLIVSAMLQDELAARSQHVPFADGPDDFPCDRITIRRIGEYDVHRAGMVGEVIETPNGVCHPDPAASAKPTEGEIVFYRTDGAPVVVDEQAAARTAAKRFNAQASCACAQVQHRTVDDSCRQDVEQ